MESWMWVLWLAIFAIAMIVEVSVSGLISIWISLAALITLPLSFIEGLPFWGEIIIFISLSLILLAVTRPFVRKFLKEKEAIKTNLEGLIGEKVKLTKKIEGLNLGEAKINGVNWDCKSIDGKAIKEGKVVEIVKLEGNKLVVKEINHE